MSFILDALKKLEHKHQQGSVPDLMTVHSPTLREPRKHLLWLYLFLAAMLINAGILAAFLRPWESKNQDVIAQSSTEQQQESNSPAPVNDKSAGTEAMANNEKASPVPDTLPVKTTLKSVNIDEISGDKLIDLEAGEEKTVQNEQALIDNTAASLDLNPSAREIEILREKIKEDQSPADNLSLMESPPIENVETGSEKRVIELSQLPSDIRKELPDISIKGHIYSDNPSSRIVNINGIIMREGDTLITDLKVEEITMSGVIFDYRGFGFYIRAF